MRGRRERKRDAEIFFLTVNPIRSQSLVSLSSSCNHNSISKTVGKPVSEESHNTSDCLRSMIPCIGITHSHTSSHTNTHAHKHKHTQPRSSHTHTHTHSHDRCTQTQLRGCASTLRASDAIKRLNPKSGCTFDSSYIASMNAYSSFFRCCCLRHHVLRRRTCCS